MTNINPEFVVPLMKTDSMGPLMFTDEATWCGGEKGPAIRESEAEYFPDDLIPEETYRELMALADNIMETVRAVRDPVGKGLSAPFLMQFAILKFITLVKAMVLVSIYYRDGDIEMPPVRYSDLLDPEANQDLRVPLDFLALLLVQDPPHTNAMAQSFTNLTKVMNVLFDLLAAIFVDKGCTEDDVLLVPELRAAFTAFIRITEDGDAAAACYKTLLERFTQVASRISLVDTDLVRHRPKPANRAARERRALLREEGDPNSLPISQRIKGVEVALAFGKCENEISNWNCGRHRPKEYHGPYPNTGLGRDQLAEDARVYKNRMILEGKREA